jgi:hypothetical protein
LIISYPETFAFSQRLGGFFSDTRESPDRAGFFCGEARGIACPATDRSEFDALHDRSHRVRIAPSRVLAHLFTGPIRYNWR